MTQYSKTSPSSDPDQTPIPGAWEKYRHLWKRMEAPAKTVVLTEGEISRKVFVIEKGCVRTWFHHEGKEICFQFFFEGDVVSSAESFRKNTPSDQAEAFRLAGVFFSFR